MTSARFGVAAAPPEMAAWNLALRFGLELAALTGLAIAAWRLTSAPLRPIAVVGVPLIAAAAWGVFNVVGDPSRSGSAPIEVPGWTRLLVELAVLGAGTVAFAMAGWRPVAVGYAALVVLHNVAAWPRIHWLLTLGRG